MGGIERTLPVEKRKRYTGRGTDSLPIKLSAGIQGPVFKYSPNLDAL